MQKFIVALVFIWLGQAWASQSSLVEGLYFLETPQDSGKLRISHIRFRQEGFNFKVRASDLLGRIFVPKLICEELGREFSNLVYVDHPVSDRIPYTEVVWHPTVLLGLPTVHPIIMIRQEWRVPMTTAEVVENRGRYSVKIEMPQSYRLPIDSPLVNRLVTLETFDCH